MAPREDVLLKIDSFGNGADKESEEKNFQCLPERSAQTMRRRGKESSDSENRRPSSASGGGEVLRCSSNASFRGCSWSSPISKKSRLMDPPEEDSSQKLETAVSEEGKNQDETEDMPEEYNQLKLSPFSVLQWVIFVIVIVGLICNRWVPILKRKSIWDLPLWKWELTVLALICGRLISTWAVGLIVKIIERNFLLRKRVLYFVYGLRRAVRNCLWLSLLLLVWHFIFNEKVQRTTRSKILPYITKILICFLVGASIWLLKTLAVKILASFFHVNNYFERLKEALFSQYVIVTLSGSPLFERSNTEDMVKDNQNADGREESPKSGRIICSGRLVNCDGSRQLKPESSRQDEEIPVDQLNKLNQHNISAWNMRRMMNIVRNGALLTLDEKILSETKEEYLLQIRSERQAKEAAGNIFRRVSRRGSEFINLDDVMRFMNKEEALMTMSLFGPDAETQCIDEFSFREWMVNAFNQRKVLVLSLNDANTAVDGLHNLLNIFVAVTILTVFEAIIFLFVMHPFDVGDRCEVDGVQMVVEEMRILTTVFLRYDNQKITYPNSVLATKAIGNYYRSPDMGEGVDFYVHISTPSKKVSLIKEQITRYIESKSEEWHPAPVVTMKDVEDLEKVKMSVCVTHKMNHQDMGERWNRRAALVEEIVKIFRQLDDEHQENVQNLASGAT
ncbi:mechanosensitive ion channel protein 6-like isoform X2 [Momordica charantia]|uniref:Mechanosensitive ion channel protein n=1 Tax=Momordica charantia TaxID=3673 RepID=A0A6J1CH06_MOMCH|nr:mechanosensitive ion channel protein 6-like isoform X2 [Momordica charantia]